MAHYVDGFVVPVPRDRLHDYQALAEMAGSIWKEYGALSYWECVGDDVPVGELTSFPRSVQLKDDEVVVFAWIVYESKDQRDAINAKVMNDERFKQLDQSRLPFDGKRMFWGGFRSIVEK